MNRSARLAKLEGTLAAWTHAEAWTVGLRRHLASYFADVWMRRHSVARAPDAALTVAEWAAMAAADPRALFARVERRAAPFSTQE